MKTRVLLISLSVLLLLPNFIRKDINGVPEYNKIERYNPRLGNITSVEELEAYVDNQAAQQQISIYSEKYTALLAYIISCRFYHGFSHFSLNENWVAALGQKLFGYGLASKVKPEDIMQHPYAACSQQAIVMMEVLRRKNISYRKVSFPHHYALEVKISDHWYFFDPNMEPNISLTERAHENWNGDNDKLKKYYSAKHGNVNWEFGNKAKATFGIINEKPARNAQLFQSATAFIGKILWCVPLVFVFARKRRKSLYVVKSIKHYREGNMAPVYQLKYYF